MKNYLALIKFSHTVFALPFALLGFFYASQTTSIISWRLLVLVVLCMIFARSAAMAFNRYLDRNIDAQNPRTAVREIPRGVVSPNSALGFTILNSILFIVTTWFINKPCFYLSFLALAIVLGYSYMKRVTALCHIVLGVGLSLAPLGGYLAVAGKFNILPIVLAVGVLCWVAGFDIIYALQDEEFDKGQGLKSIPSILGKRKAMLVSNSLHFLSAMMIILSIWLAANSFPSVGWLAWLASAFFVGMLIFQHRLVKPNDLSKVNLAFFTTNGVASLVFSSLLIIDLYLF